MYTNEIKKAHSLRSINFNANGFSAVVSVVVVTFVAVAFRFAHAC